MDCCCVQADEGIDLRGLAPGTVLKVSTRNTCYRFIVVHGRHDNVVVQGGCWFPVETLARVDGAAARGRLPKKAWIGIGLHLEIAFGHDQRIVTSRVCSIEVVSPPGVPEPGIARSVSDSRRPDGNVRRESVMVFIAGLRSLANFLAHREDDPKPPAGGDGVIHASI
jgi:hypothetical protein